MKKLTKTLLLLIPCLINIPSFAQSACEQILKQGIYDYYQLQNESNFDYVFKKLVSMSREDIEQQISERTLDASIPIPLASGFLKLLVGASDEQERYRHLKESYLNNTETKISASDRTWLYTKVANANIINAWQKCAVNEEMSIEVKGNTQKEFAIVLIYKPKNGHARGTVLSSISPSSNLKALNKAGENRLFRGRTISPFNSYTQSFQRRDSAAFSLVLNIAQFPEPLTIEVPAIPQPLPVYEVHWFSSDQSGNPYVATYRPAKVNAHHDGDCCGQRKDAEVSLADLGIKNARIERVSYSCDGSYCGWCYNQNGAGGGYAGQIQINGNAQSFHWWRNYDGREVTETYQVFYQKPRGVCIKNCQKLITIR